MRSNQPITNKEYILSDSETIVSKTDLRGNITYINDDFLRISGFTEEELLGQPHNIVRHPEMPVEAFADLWHTLKSGKAWTGMVKNRCKNGDHYWVEANVAPLIENFRVIGYTSIRGKPSRERVKATEAVYRAIQSGHSGLVISEGKAVSRSSFPAFKKLTALSLSAKLSMAFALPAFFSAANAMLAWTSQGDAAWTIGMGVIGTVAALAMGAMTKHDIIARLQKTDNDIERMSSGDLTGSIEAFGNDELARVRQGLKILQINVKLLIGQISQSSNTVNAGAAEITAGVFDLSARTESQASSLEQTAAAMEELTSTVKQNADNAQQASSLVISTSAIAVKGGEAVSHVVNTMSSIKESSNKIADIIGVINGIAFQTNILALNAAVEAARAGEQGRGFAVVASEVRNLAQRSASAAKEIKELIDNSVATVNIGSKLVDDAGKTMTEIVDSVRRAASIMGEISHSGREQSIGIGQVNESIAHMDEITQQNAALVEQAAAASATMKEQSDRLGELVGAFKLMSSSHVSKAPTGARASKPTSPQ